ncbi:MAG: hypothetical protein FWF03_01925, partial [Defluviitaleaceae bacterium]|nr:hypothetical protein [Defluviitaleaceae bacterium]
TDLPAQGTVTLMEQKKEGRYVCHLLYASPVARGNGIQVIEDIVPIYDVNVSVSAPNVIKGAKLVPQNVPVSLERAGKAVKFIVPRLECHQMIELAY